MGEIGYDDMRPLDKIISHKRVPFGLWPPYRPLEHLADRGILSRQEEMYPGGLVDGNHVRVFVGYAAVRVPAVSTSYHPAPTIVQAPLVFEWTYPRARLVQWESWMVDPSYARTYRHEAAASVSEAEVLQYAFAHDGLGYDWLQLLGIWFGIKWLHLGSEREVCSSGAREMFEDLTGLRRIFPESDVWETLPAAWENHPTEWVCTNHVDEEPRKLSDEPFRTVGVELIGV